MSKHSRYKTHRGREFNMAAFIEKNGDQRAVGNASMNARGDIIDQRTGEVKLTAIKIAHAAANMSNKESKKVSLKADETITPVKREAPAADVKIDPEAPPVVDKPTVVSSRKVKTLEGFPATEHEYSDGSIAIVPDSEDTSAGQG